MRLHQSRRSTLMRCSGPEKLAPLEIIRPDWPAAARVKSLVTTRAKGVSLDDFAGLNLAGHVGDLPAHVQSNRDMLTASLSLQREPVWLSQAHGADIVNADQVSVGATADASWSNQANTVCAILTADCLPVLFCDRAGSVVAAAHAGWRGLVAGVLENSLSIFFESGVAAEDIMVWLGPAIGPTAYEVDAPVREAFLGRSEGFATSFISTRPGHWNFDIYSAARIVLDAHGVNAVYGGDLCTLGDQRFYSYRRQNRCGRQAALIYISD